MSRVYTLRKTGRYGNPDDYVFGCDGVEVGRCYLRTLNNNERQWSWTIYLGWHVKRTLEGVPTVGYAPTLEDAKHRFRECFDRMIEAGVVTLT